MSLTAASAARRAGVDKSLLDVLDLAAQTCPFDLVLLEGVRSTMRQAELYAARASQTMDSAHLSGDAVDIGAVLGGDVRWDWPLYYTIAVHMQQACISLAVPLRWGGCWDTELSIGSHPESMASGYASRRRAMGRKAFLDGPHYELWVRRTHGPQQQPPTAPPPPHRP